MKKLFGVLILIQMFSLFSSAQVTQEWVARYNAPADSGDIGYDVASDVSGNIYVTGYSRGQGTDYDFLTVKYNPSGVQQWTARYNAAGNSSEYASLIALDDSANVYVCGYGGPISNLNVIIVKYNSSGDQQWVQSYGSGSSDFPASIAVDAAGNIYVTASSLNGTYNILTVKYNSAGTQQWSKQYNGPASGTDLASDIAVDASGNVYVTGQSQSAASADYITIKYNSGGAEEWVKRYTSPGIHIDVASAIALDAGGNIYITGNSVIGNSIDYLTIKYSSAGDSLWVRAFNGPANSADLPVDIVVAGNGDVYVTGSSIGIGTSEDYCTIKYSSSGLFQWESRYDGSGGDLDFGSTEDVVSQMVLDAGGNAYITGRVLTSSGGQDYCTIKYNTSGAQQWIQFYGSAGNRADEPYSIILDGTGNVCVTGYSSQGNMFTDYVTIKYSQTIGIHNISGEIPEEFSLSQNYPNPFNPATNIKFQLPKAGFVKLTVFDMLGREVESLVNENLSAGTYNADWNASNYSSGVYFYKLEADHFTEAKRMILVK